MQSRNSAALDLDTTASVKAFARVTARLLPKAETHRGRLSALTFDPCFYPVSPFGLYVNFLTILGTNAIQGVKYNSTRYKE